MIRLISVMLFGLLFLNAQVFAQTETNSNAPEQKTQTVNEEVPISEEELTKDFNFTDTSYLTDEQLQEAKEVNDIEEKTSFSSKIINSGHFTSGTATKTYIPINKILE